MAGSGYKDYFQVLGVNRGADADAIKKAFRKLARQYHPDVNPGDQAAEARFKEISEAYEVLSDPDKRRQYEQFGQYWNQAGGSAGAPGMDVDFGRYGNFDDFINDLLGRFGGPGGLLDFKAADSPVEGSPVGSQEGVEHPDPPSIWTQKPRSMSASLKRFEAVSEPCR